MQLIWAAIMIICDKSRLRDADIRVLTLLLRHSTRGPNHRYDISHVNIHTLLSNRVEQVK
jgi:hypothetical protein